MDSPAERARIERRRPQRPLPAHRQWTPLGRALYVAGDNWTLAIVSELSSGRTRLSSLRERLSGVSAGVLDRYLQRMNEAGLITRIRFREMPPRVELELTEAGRELLPIVSAFAHWGRRWAWTEPREGELLDVAALLRALPSLMSGPVRAPDGAVELVLDERGGRKREIAEIDGGSVSIWRDTGERIEPEITSGIAGDWRAWTAALGPEADRSELRFSGRRSQAERLLAAVVPPGPEQDRPQPSGGATERQQPAPGNEQPQPDSAA